MKVTAKNTLNAKVGDVVVLNIRTSSLLKLSFLLYIFPVICMIAGAILGKNIANIFKLDETILSVLSGFSSLIVSFFLIRARGNSMAGKKEYMPEIVRLKKKVRKL